MIPSGPAAVPVMVSILVVDDHAILREGVVALLEHEPGFRVVAHVSDGEAALGKLTLLKPMVVVVDVGLPDMGGAELVRKIRNRLPDTRVVVLSMHAERGVVESMLAEGIDGYVHKGDSFRELTTAINSALKDRRASDSWRLVPRGQDVPNFAHSRSAFWARFRVRNDTGGAGSWRLILADARLADRINLFRRRAERANQALRENEARLEDLVAERTAELTVVRDLRADPATGSIPVIAVTAAVLGDRAEEAARVCEHAQVFVETVGQSEGQGFEEALGIGGIGSPVEVVIAGAQVPFVRQLQ